MQVWKQKKVWEGFIKCCERTKPQSLMVLLTLPAEQLSEALDFAPDLRLPLLDEVSTFDQHQVRDLLFVSNAVLFIFCFSLYNGCKL